jgi:hypothetical protein
LAKQLSDVPDAETSHQIESVHLDRSNTDLQFFGDLAIREPLGN